MYKLRPNPASVELWPADERLIDPQWAPGSVAGEAVARVTRSPFPSAPPLAMAPTDAAPRAMISRKLEDLLIREAHLRLIRAELVPALGVQEAAEKKVVEARPRWLSFHAKETRVAYESRLAEVRETAQMLRDGIAQLNRVEPHIRRMLRDEVEDLLRTRCPEYVQALAARDQKEDWRRCLNRFAQRMHDFLQALGSARNMACTAYTRDRQVFSPAAVQGFVLASECAKQVEGEVQFANRVADLQRVMFRESGLEAAALPRLPTTAFSRAVATIASVPLATPTACGEPTAAANSASKASTLGPRMNAPLSTTPAMASSIRGRSGSSAVRESNRAIPIEGQRYPPDRCRSLPSWSWPQ